MMEILRAAGERGTGGIPAHHHNVEEWSNLDPYGGIREHKRVETDHWANKTRNSSHQYGKVVDSRARNLADGSREQLKQMKQLEVFQARVPGGGSVQVIRSHTSTTSSKTSGHSWTNSKMIDTSTPVFEPSMDFDNLKLSIMPLNLNSEKSRISLGRSGSMNKRRPPTRPRSLLCSDDTSETILPVAAAPAEPEPKPQPTKQPEPKIKLAELSSNSDRIGTRYTTPSVRFIKSEIGKSAERQKASEKSTTAPYKSPTIVRNESLKSPKIFRSLIGNKKGPVNLPDVEKASEHEHRPLEAKKSVSSEDVSQDYEGYGGDPNLQRSSAARRSLNLHKDYHWSSQHTNELENVFKKVLKNKTFYNQTAFDDDDLTRETVEDHNEPFSNAPVKKSFVSVETIKNIRNNLKPVEDVGVKAETEEREAVKLVLDVNGESDRVKNYNTGSLETRQTRNEEWYNRRKSYGFEQMKETNDPQHSSGQSLKNIESSTDSGIAKSNENIDSLVRKGIVNPSNDLFEVRRNSLSKSSKIYTALMSLRDSNKKSDFENPGNSQYEISTDKNGESKVRDLTSNAEFNGYSQSLKDTQNEPLTITIKPKEEHTSVVSIPNNNEMKVESTMTDDGEFFRKVKEIYDKGAWADDKNGDNKKTKKVEFSKTEVHFEPGKVNIIETNEKPPPINYRRRKKDRVAKNAERAERNAVKLDKHKDHFPETKFGDEMKQSPVIALPYETKEQIAHDQPTETNIEIIVDETSEDESKRPKSILKAGKIEETTNENVDQTRTDFQKILNSFKTCERQNTTSPPIVDSGLKVRISSGNNQFDQRRASWCVPETGNKFSTKINFGADNITVLPQKTRYSYCEPSERTIQSLVSQSGTVNDATEERNKIDSFEGHPVSQSNTVCNNEFSRFRTKSPLSSVTKTFLNSEPVVSYNGFVPKSDETMKVLEALRTNGDVPKEIEPKILETVQRRNPEGRSSDLSSSILNRYSFTESSESPVMSKRSQKPARYSYVEPTSTSSTSTAEPIWYQQGRPGKEQNLNSHSGNTTKAESKKTTDAVRVTSISLHYEPKPAKAKTFQPVCLIYKPESLTNKNYEDPQHVLENEIETTNVTSRSCHSKTKTSVQENIKEVKGPSREPKSSDQKRITNELKQINDYINLSSSKTAEKSTRRSDRLVKDETPKRPARKIKEEPIYERIKIRSKKEIPAEKDPIRAKNTREHASVKSSGRDGWLNIPKDNVHASRSKDSKVRSRDSSVESNHIITNRSRTSSVNSNIRSRTSSLESNSQLHSAVLLRSRKDDIEQRSRTSSIDSNRSTNLRNSSRINSNNSTPVRSRTSSIESNRSYQGISKPKPDAQKSRLTTAIQTRRSTISQTRESRTKPVITENKRCTKQLLESANRGICPKEISSKSKQYQSHTVASRSRNSSADSTIMEELTKAADEILLAVNGYTDEDSIRGSDDERKRRKSYKPLSTISEAPNKVDSSKRSRKSEASVIVRENVYSNVKNQRRSSNSSLENNDKTSRETKPKAQENIYANIKTVKQSSSNEKIAKKKAARMQRSSSREILASSSDEENNLNDLKNKKPVRRSKGKSNSLEVSQDKKCDKTDKTPQRKPRSSSMIRSVANHIIDTVSPVLTADKTNSTDKKSSLKNVLFSKHSINGLKSSSMQKDIKSSPAQNPKSSNTKTSSSVKKK